jgi:hypothetical protein
MAVAHALALVDELPAPLYACTGLAALVTIAHCMKVLDRRHIVAGHVTRKVALAGTTFALGNAQASAAADAVLKFGLTWPPIG